MVHLLPWLLRIFACSVGVFVPSLWLEFSSLFHIFVQHHPSLNIFPNLLAVVKNIQVLLISGIIQSRTGYDKGGSHKLRPWQVVPCIQFEGYLNIYKLSSGPARHNHLASLFDSP